MVMTTNKQKIKAYEDIFTYCSKAHTEFGLDDYLMSSIYRQIEAVRQQVYLTEEFGIPVVHSVRNTWVKVAEYSTLGMFSGDRTISWSDDGKQPDNEWLYVLSFPCGAYTFGNVFSSEYPTRSFNTFFEVLRAYNPKYSDTANHTLYFSSDKAKVVHEALPELLIQCKKLAQEELKENTISELQKKIDEIKGE